MYPEYVRSAFSRKNATIAAEGDKYMVFQINDSNYAVPSGEVAEVVRMLPLTELPNLPDWFMGIANLRGDILSVINLPGIWDPEVGLQYPEI